MSHSGLQSIRRINAICCDFESSWQAGRRPQIETVVAQAEPEDRTLLLAELIALELELRLADGEPAELDEYQRRFAAEAKAVAVVGQRITAAGGNDAARSTRETFESSFPSDRLQLGDQLGAGGMGVVVRAYDRWLKRNLAVKVLAEHLETRREAIERFLREARICARLQHPGIVPIHDMGWMDSRPYFAMKLVTGQSLATALETRPRADHELPRWLEVFARVCETIAYAHAQGVAHRDLKPANVMLGSYGEVYVIDWGLARVLDEDDPASGDLREAKALTGDRLRPTEETVIEDVSPPPGKQAAFAWTFLGEVMGTPAYMPPEQARGDVESMDRRSDVFALGAMLCEILTGASLYPSASRMTQLERAQLGDLSEAFHRLEACSAERELIDLARECLAIEPADRPPDAEYVSQRLSAFLRSVQEKLRSMELKRAEAQARVQERRRRRGVLLTLTVSLLILLGLFAGGGIWTAQREAARRRDEAAQREQLHRQLSETLDEIAQLYAAAPENGHTDPSRRSRIRELARRAETLAESVWAEATHIRRVQEVRDRIQGEDADSRLLDRLEAIRLKGAEVNPRTNKFASGRTRPMYRYAFNDYGLDLEKTDAQQAAARIRNRPPHVVEACVFALEDWRSLFRSSTAPPRQWMDAVLDGIDDDPWRCAVRRACREEDWPVVRDLINTAKDETISVDAVNGVASRLMNASQFDLAVELLQAAQPKYSGDFWINQYLGLVLYVGPDPQFDESLRYLTAALAIRDTAASRFNLGMVLFELGRDAEAELAFRSALQRQPDYVQAHLSLADVLQRQGRDEEAAALRKRAEDLQAGNR